MASTTTHCLQLRSGSCSIKETFDCDRPNFVFVHGAESDILGRYRPVSFRFCFLFRLHSKCHFRWTENVPFSICPEVVCLTGRQSTFVSVFVFPPKMHSHFCFRFVFGPNGMLFSVSFSLTADNEKFIFGQSLAVVLNTYLGLTFSSLLSCLHHGVCKFLIHQNSLHK